MSSATATAESLYQWWLICTAAPNKVIIRNDKHQRVAHLRTIELFRSVGIENAVRLASENQFPPDGGISAVESLAGKEIATYIANLNEGVGKYSPTVRLFMTQQSLEPVLRARAAELGATLQYSTELTSFDQDADGVTATIQDRNTGEQRRVRAKYLVAADENRSPIRERLGIGMRGHGH